MLQFHQSVEMRRKARDVLDQIHEHFDRLQNAPPGTRFYDSPDYTITWVNPAYGTGPLSPGQTTYGANPATSVQTTTISEPSSNDGSNFSVQWLGYFLPSTTETYTFFTSSDDASYVWVFSIHILIKP